MVRRICFVVMSLVFLSAGADSCLWAQAQYETQELQAGRYVLVMFKGTGGNYGRSNLATKTPALVLDTYLGIVWRCLNLQDDRPVWIKADLAKLGSQAPLAKRYSVKILEWPSTELKLPAILLDMQEGKVWTCPNIMDESAKWLPKDLVKDIKDDGYRYP